MGTRPRWVIIGVIVGLIGLTFAGYWFNWDWTGFNQHIGPQVQQFQPTKTLWDWLQLLIIPLVLAVAALLFNRATTSTERQIAAKRYEQDREIALDKQREDLLQAYLDRMSELLLEKSLATSPSEEARNVARVRTITILFQLDARRIGYVFAFLREAGLMSTKPNSSIVNLSQANLTKINLSQAKLIRADLSEANLWYANLSGADLGGANLSKAFLYQANLNETTLYQADLSGANLIDANLSGAFLSEANLSGALQLHLLTHQ